MSSSVAVDQITAEAFLVHDQRIRINELSWRRRRSLPRKVARRALVKSESWQMQRAWPRRRGRSASCSTPSRSRPGSRRLWPRPLLVGRRLPKRRPKLRQPLVEEKPQRTSNCPKSRPRQESKRRFEMDPVRRPRRPRRQRQLLPHQ